MFLVRESYLVKNDKIVCVKNRKGHLGQVKLLKSVEMVQSHL